LSELKIVFLRFSSWKFTLKCIVCCFLALLQRKVSIAVIVVKITKLYAQKIGITIILWLSNIVLEEKSKRRWVDNKMQNVRRSLSRNIRPWRKYSWF
jgi:hypothetical protein